MNEDYENTTDAEEVDQTIDELFTKIRLKLFDIRQANPQTVEELKNLLAQLQGWVQSLVLDSIRLKEVEAAQKKKRQAKKKTGYKTIDAYIKTFPEDVQTILEKIRQTIQKAAPEAVEAISYQMPTFKLNGTNLVHFAAWKNHIGFYPTPSGTEAFQKELSPYKAAKGSVQFPLDKPIPFALVKRIVLFRIKEESRRR